ERIEISDPQLGAVPGHPRVVPGKPRQPLSYWVESRSHEEVVAGDEHDRLGGTIGRQRDKLVVDVAVAVPLADADHGLPVRCDNSVRVPQRVRLRGFRADRPRLRTGAVYPIQAAVGELGVEDGFAVVPDGAAAVLVNAGACVRARRDQIHDLAVRTRLDDGGTATFVGSRLGPADSIFADVYVGVAGARRARDQIRPEWRRPRAVRAEHAADV